MIESKCIPCLLYDWGMLLGTIEMNSLNFAVKRILFKIFRTNSDEFVVKCHSCQLYFDFPDMSVLLTVRKKQFLTKFSSSDNCLYA